MDINSLEPGRLVATRAGQLIRVQGVKLRRLRAEIVYPLQKAPLFREFSETEVRAMRDPSPELLAKYERAVDARRASGKRKR